MHGANMKITGPLLRVPSYWQRLREDW